MPSWPQPSHAQDTNYLTNNASHCDIFKGLSRELPTECQKAPKTRGLKFRSIKTRGIVFHPDPQQQQQQQQAQNSQEQVQVASNNQAAAPAQSNELSISFRAEFEYNSARLTPAARSVIDKVAAVLNPRADARQGHPGRGAC